MSKSQLKAKHLEGESEAHYRRCVPPCKCYKLNINCPVECHVEPQRGKLDERFLQFKTPPPHRSLPFFPDLHTEVSRSWAKPFSAHLFVPSSDYYGNESSPPPPGEEIGLPNLSRTVFQGAAISSEHTSQFFPPGDVAELRCSSPLRGSLEQQLAVLITAEVSLERLVALLDYLAAWILLPNVSQWVLHTVERLQNPVWFSSASIQRGGSHSGGP